MIDIEKAKIDPTSVFNRPRDILKESTLTREQKIDILKRWEYDEREMAVAEGENMRSSNGDHHSHLDEILTCLRDLDADHNGTHSTGTQHG